MGKRVIRECLCRLFYGYLRLLEKTVRLEAELPEGLGSGIVAGFWHEDSFIMNLVLKRLAADRDISVIVTADERGEYIESLLEKYGGTAIRLPDGDGSRRFMKELTKEAQNPDKSIAAALDGPLGPRRIPKSLAFYLSEKGNKEFVVLETAYSKAVSLNWRWDRYKIPLPFTTVAVTAGNLGIADRESRDHFRRMVQDFRENEEADGKSAGENLKNILQSPI